MGWPANRAHGLMRKVLSRAAEKSMEIHCFSGLCDCWKAFHCAAALHNLPGKNRRDSLGGVVFWALARGKNRQNQFHCISLESHLGSAGDRQISWVLALLMGVFKLPSMNLDDAVSAWQYAFLHCWPEPHYSLSWFGSM